MGSCLSNEDLEDVLEHVRPLHRQMEAAEQEIQHLRDELSQLKAAHARFRAEVVAEVRNTNQNSGDEAPDAAVKSLLLSHVDAELHALLNRAEDDSKQIDQCLQHTKEQQEKYHQQPGRRLRNRNQREVAKTSGMLIFQTGRSYDSRCTAELLVTAAHREVMNVDAADTLKVVRKNDQSGDAIRVFSIGEHIGALETIPVREGEQWEIRTGAHGRTNCTALWWIPF